MNIDKIATYLIFFVIIGGLLLGVAVIVRDIQSASAVTCDLRATVVHLDDTRTCYYRCSTTKREPALAKKMKTEAGYYCPAEPHLEDFDD